MTRLTIDWDDLLAFRGRTMYWLAKELGLPYSTVHYIVREDPQGYNREIVGRALQLLNVKLSFPFSLAEDLDEREPEHDSSGNPHTEDDQ